MAQSVYATPTQYNTPRSMSGAMRDMCLDCLSAADGTVTYNTEVIPGIIERVVIIPNTGATKPSDLFDVTLKDADGVDILQGSGANCSCDIPTNLVPGMAVNGVLALEITNAGDSLGVDIRIYYR